MVLGFGVWFSVLVFDSVLFFFCFLVLSFGFMFSVLIFGSVLFFGVLVLCLGFWFSIFGSCFLVFGLWLLFLGNTDYNIAKYNLFTHIIHRTYKSTILYRVTSHHNKP